MYLFLATLGLHHCMQASSAGEWGLLELWCAGCGGFACCRAQSRACAFSSCGSRALERWLSGCGARAQLLCSVWDPPGSGFKSVSPALAGGFLTIRSPGKSSAQVFNWVAFGFLILSFMSSLCTLDFNPYESARLLQWVVFSFCW